MVGAGNVAQSGYFASRFGSAGSDGDYFETGIRVSFELHIAHDEAAAYDADSVVAPDRRWSLVMELEVFIQGDSLGGNAYDSIAAV